MKKQEIKSKVKYQDYEYIKHLGVDGDKLRYFRKLNPHKIKLHTKEFSSIDNINKQKHLRYIWDYANDNVSTDIVSKEFKNAELIIINNGQVYNGTISGIIRYPFRKSRLVVLYKDNKGNKKVTVTQKLNMKILNRSIGNECRVYEYNNTALVKIADNLKLKGNMHIFQQLGLSLSLIASQTMIIMAVFKILQMIK